ncbi:MAG TPA: NAD(P)-dependent oxidoreductase [Steroidobacteraceae bacterium]
MSRVAFIGLGRMGSGMARAVLAAGHPLTVFNRTAARCEELAGLGVSIASSPARACEGADAVISMVADDAASRAVWEGPDGILAGDLKQGALAIECSTLSHAWVMQLASKTSARGLRYIDAPVTGLASTAAAGGLTLLVGADAADLESARPLLTGLANRIVHFGPVGSGTAYKLIINLLGAVQIASAAESMALAESAGLNLATVAEAISTGQAASPQVVRNTQRMVEGQHERDILFTPQLRLKDVRYAIELADELGMQSPFGELARRTFEQLCQLGHGDVNESSVLEVARRRRS